MITILNKDALLYNFGEHELIFTDPPYELSGSQLNKAFNNINSNHCVMLCTMRQLIELTKISEWELRFDFVWDFVAPKKSKQWSQPHYTHSTGVYLTRNNDKSLFSRKNKTYFPTVIRANRQVRGEGNYTKNQESTTELLSMFNAQSVIDPFAGNGTTGFSAVELNKRVTLNDLSEKQYSFLKNAFSFFNSTFT